MTDRCNWTLTGAARPDDKDQFDKAWRAGVFRELREWRKLMPWALTSGHSQGYPDPEIAEIFNGQGIGFYTADVIEGQQLVPRPLGLLQRVVHA